MAAAWESAEAPDPLGSEGKKKDAAYPLYKEGYHLILDGKWEEARKKFAEMMKQYSSSAYMDDAEYWSAYALMYLDEKKAAKEYEKFISRHPDSRYYDDAVADLSGLDGSTVGRPVPVPMATKAPMVWSSSSSGRGKGRGKGMMYIDSLGGDGFVMSSESLVVHNLGSTLRSRGVKGYVYSSGNPPVLRSLNRALTLQSRALRAVRLPDMAHTPRAELAPGLFEREEDLDQETRLKLEALEALGSSKQDSAAFRALKDVALDRSANRRLRTAAMEQLVDFEAYDPLPVYLEVAKKDTGLEIQSAAIDYIGMLTKDKDRSVETLIELFYAIPNNRAEQRGNVFYSIAEVGNDRAVDFLAKIAQAHEQYNLRSEAIYYLGSIGNERSRAALYQILREK
jgi:HEAT repeat protein